MVVDMVAHIQIIIATIEVDNLEATAVALVVEIPPKLEVV
tara:strand:+ start:98 stop:217 length:120 start_codon:yes stop_codon:yes gene_type:complete